MNSGASDPALIGIDWGTSSFRAYLIGGAGAVIDRIAAPNGILQVGDSSFETVFDRHVGPWLARHAVPVVLSGMISSRNGWIETPYLPLPAGAADLAGALTVHRLPSGRDIRFVTGLVATDDDGAPDVMRGEETEVVGAIADGAATQRLVIPGTHSKWIGLQDDRITAFATHMTGEVFAALRDATILGRLMEPGPFSEEGFTRGVHAGLKTGSVGLLHRLFAVRTLPLTGRLEGSAVADFLSGLLIGAEIADALAQSGSGAVTVVGRGDLVVRYSRALALAGCEAIPAPQELAARGQFAIAKEAGLV